MGNARSQQSHEVQATAIQDQSLTEPITCEICIEPFSLEKHFNNNNRCMHPICVDCITKYIELQVEIHNIGNIPCPALNCKQVLDPLFCRSIISEQVFEKWCHALCASSVLEVEIEYRCYCPYQECSELILSEYKAEKAQCPNCKRYLCFKCQIPWHAGYRCEESGQYRDRNDVLFGQLVESKGWGRCHKCGRCIERVGGCSLVYCRCGATVNCNSKTYNGSTENLWSPETCRSRGERLFEPLFCLIVHAIVVALFIHILGATTG